MMAKLTDWIKKTVVGLVDPDRDERIEMLTRTLHQALVAQKQQFSVAAVLRGVEVSDRDLAQAKERVFRTIVGRGWSDGKLTPEEQQVAQWAAERLELAPTTAREINIEFATGHFAAALAKAMEDGILDAREEAQLRDIAASLGMSLPQFAGRFFHREGEAFLRSIFMACIADGTVLESEWKYLLTTTQKLGIAHNEMLAAIQPQAQRFVEHVLADAKSDGRLSAQEDTSLEWLLMNLGLPQSYCEYVQQEIETLRTLTALEQGRLPSLATPRGVELRAGEIVHCHTSATWRWTRMLKNGPQSDDHHGELTFTDHRLIFSSPTKSQSMGYRKIVAHRGTPGWLEIQFEGKPATAFYLAQPSPVPYAIFSAAVAMANQTRTATVAGTPARHISRDVRQRVWQRYGGQCADCGASDYLEFDHIIPVAKGGGNSDNNVQLLCRRCNLRKSDNI